MAVSEHQYPVRTAAGTRTLEAIAGQVASVFIHPLVPAFRPPAHLVCPSDEAEQVVDTVTRAAVARGIPVDVIDLRPGPAERLDAVTARLGGWQGESLDHEPDTMPTLLILRAFDVFGDVAHEAPTYPFRSEFQFDRKFLWLFVGGDASRMRFLFGSYRRPLYQAAGDITPDDWRPARQTP